MQKGVVLAVVFFGSLMTAWASGKDPVTVESLQREMARLESELQKMKEQLAQILKEQKSSQKVIQRLEPITIRGYIQMRYEKNTALPTDASNVTTDRAKETFRLRRSRLDVRVTPVKGVLYRIHVDGSGRHIALMDSYLQMQVGDGTVTFGHFKVPLLEEVIESSADRWTPERALVSDRLFFGLRDRGIAYSSVLDGGKEVTVGLFSGTLSRDTQDSLTTRKSWMLRLAVPIGRNGRWGKAWIGMMDGIGRRNFGTDAAPNILNFQRERQVIGLNLRSREGLVFRSEWVRGRDFGTAARPTARVHGWYALVGYQVPDQPVILYAKRDLFDPDRATPRNTFSRWALGVQYDVNRMSRMNLTWENQKNPSATVWTFQTQLRY